MYEDFREDDDWRRYLFGLAVVLAVAGLVFLYLWLNTQAILVKQGVSEMALEVKRLETELLELEYWVEAALSPEALLQRVKDLNEDAKAAGRPPLVPLNKEQIILLSGDVERGGH